MTIEELRLIESVIKGSTSSISLQTALFIINREIKLKLFDPNDNRNKDIKDGHHL